VQVLAHKRDRIVIFKEVLKIVYLLEFNMQKNSLTYKPVVSFYRLLLMNLKK